MHAPPCSIVRFGNEKAARLFARAYPAAVESEPFAGRGQRCRRQPTGRMRRIPGVECLPVTRCAAKSAAGGRAAPVISVQEASTILFSPPPIPIVQWVVRRRVGGQRSARAAPDAGAHGAAKKSVMGEIDGRSWRALSPRETFRSSAPTQCPA
uniref:Uncharacterized protein n=1 Tax=Plectus sambesii TaxID=2011161 RepID=A0A914WS58_9BILA